MTYIITLTAIISLAAWATRSSARIARDATDAMTTDE